MRETLPFQCQPVQFIVTLGGSSGPAQYSTPVQTCHKKSFRAQATIAYFLTSIVLAGFRVNIFFYYYYFAIGYFCAP